MNKNTESTHSNVEMLHVSDDSSKAMDYFFQFKYFVNKITEMSGASLTDGEQTSTSLLLLKILLGEKKLYEYIDKMEISRYKLN